MSMTIWERLERYGHIKNLKRKNDVKNYDVFLENGLIRIDCRKTKTSQTITIDSFLYLFMENLPCEYQE